MVHSLVGITLLAFGTFDFFMFIYLLYTYIFIPYKHVLHSMNIFAVDCVFGVEYAFLCKTSSMSCAFYIFTRFSMEYIGILCSDASLHLMALFNRLLFHI